MLLYHGTSHKNWEQAIVEEGLVTRDSRGYGPAITGNWGISNPASNGACTYLTNCGSLALMHGFRSAIMHGEPSDTVIIGIETENLNNDNLRVDENLLSVEECGSSICSTDIRCKQIDRILDRKDWEHSLKITTMCTHVGNIETKQFGFTHVTPFENNPFLVPELFEIKNKTKRAMAHQHWLNAKCGNHWDYWSLQAPILYAIEAKTTFKETNERLMAVKW